MITYRPTLETEQETNIDELVRWHRPAVVDVRQGTYHVCYNIHIVVGDDLRLIEFVVAHLVDPELQALRSVSTCTITKQVRHTVGYLNDKLQKEYGSEWLCVAGQKMSCTGVPALEMTLDGIQIMVFKK